MIKSWQDQLNMFDQETPYLSKMIRNIIGDNIKVEVSCYEFLIEGEVQIKSLDSLVEADLSQFNFDQEDSDLWEYYRKWKNISYGCSVKITHST